MTSRDKNSAIPANSNAVCKIIRTNNTYTVFRTVLYATYTLITLIASSNYI